MASNIQNLRDSRVSSFEAFHGYRRSLIDDARFDALVKAEVTRGHLHDLHERLSKKLAAEKSENIARIFGLLNKTGVEFLCGENGQKVDANRGDRMTDKLVLEAHEKATVYAKEQELAIVIVCDAEICKFVLIIMQVCEAIFNHLWTLQVSQSSQIIELFYEVINHIPMMSSKTTTCEFISSEEVWYTDSDISLNLSVLEVKLEPNPFFAQNTLRIILVCTMGTNDIKCTDEVIVLHKIHYDSSKYRIYTWERSLKRSIKVSHLETRKSKFIEAKTALINRFDILIECSISRDQFIGMITDLADQTSKIVSVKVFTGLFELEEIWVPKNIGDLDACGHTKSHIEPDLDSRHPGFSDVEYKQRRKEIVKISSEYKYGDKIPRINYTSEETETWKTVYTMLEDLFPTHACQAYRKMFDKLERSGIYSPNFIPQLQDVSDFLQRESGFQVRPAAGLLTARDYLASLAFRVFQATQYVRHHSTPHHTPEPDCIHELLGHIPMFADPAIAQFSQEIGLASLGASDEDIEKLATLYWFTVEFGLCKENNEVRAYGAGLLSAYGELQHALSDTPKKEIFDPEITAVTFYQDEDYQPVYFVSESMDDAIAKLRQYAKRIKRPHTYCYNPLTKSLIQVDNLEQVGPFVDQLADGLNQLKASVDFLTLNQRRIR